MNSTEACRTAIDNLEKVIGVFEQELEKPVLIHGAFIYNRPMVKHVCLLKGVRIVSGLNALMVLFEAGYVTEMGVVMRTISDCINAIYFLLENFPQTTPEVEQYVSNFFSEVLDEPEIAPSLGKKRYRTKVKKIHASRARLLSEHVNFAVGRDMVYQNYSAYSGYVHASYPNIMEIYGGEPPYKFHPKGIKETSRIKDWEEVFIAFIQNAILVFGYMAEKYDKADLIQEIRRIMGLFDKAIAYLEPGT
ncbi:MAG TPA: hypothetical protein VMW16_06660 [Sedimentisphaerales bacterium]|nr:hypothetical protein [Sedimentisphaerales bacterium]